MWDEIFKRNVKRKRWRRKQNFVLGVPPPPKQLIVFPLYVIMFLSPYLHLPCKSTGTFCISRMQHCFLITFANDLSHYKLAIFPAADFPLSSGELRLSSGCYQCRVCKTGRAMCHKVKGKPSYNSILSMQGITMDVPWEVNLQPGKISKN